MFNVMGNMKTPVLILVLTFLAASSCFAQPTTIESKRKYSKLESKILDTIAKLPEVKRRAGYVEHQSKNKRRLQYLIWEKPSKKSPYYWVQVMEDNGSVYHNHFNFFVYTNPVLIKYYDIANDKILSLSKWRKDYSE
jgi:hypothetical protein